MEPNPYEAPTAVGGPALPVRSTAIKVGRWTVTRVLLCGAWMLVVAFSGIAGLVIGFMVWGRFFLIEEPDMTILTPTGALLILLTGLGFAVTTGTSLFVFWYKWWRTPN